MYLRTNQNWANFEEIPHANSGADPEYLVSAEARLPQFLGASGSPKESFAKWRCAVVGVGSVGRRIALGAARLHPQALWLVDPGVYKPESLLTQEILPPDVGDPKAHNTGRACKAISPGTRVFVYRGAVQDLPWDAFVDADHVALATDNLKAEVEAGQRCIRWRKPLIHASVHGETQVAQVRFFGNKDAAGPCPACGFGQAEWEHVNRETLFRCVTEDGGPQEKTQVPPTMSTSFLCSLAANFGLTQITRHLLSLGQSVTDTLLTYCGYTHHTTSAPLDRNPNCACEHIAWTESQPPGELEQCSITDLASAVGIQTGNEDFVVHVGRKQFVEAAWCCGECHSVEQFTDEAILPSTCPNCKSPLVAQPYFCHAWAPSSKTALDRPLMDIGGDDPAYVILKYGQSASVFRRPQLDL